MGAGVPGMEMQEEGGRMGVKMSGRTDGATRQATQGRVKKDEGRWQAPGDAAGHAGPMRRVRGGDSGEWQGRSREVEK